MIGKAFKNTDLLFKDVDMLVAGCGVVEFALENPGVTQDQRLQRFKVLLKEQQDKRKADTGADNKR